jgi:CRP/FNR family cyclic AMP-dependent transcriptional regulator
MDILDVAESAAPSAQSAPIGLRRETLRSCRLFRYMSEAECTALLGRIEWLHAHRGELLVQRHDSGGAMYIVAEGMLLVNQYARSGREVGYRRLGPGGYFGEIAAIDKLPRSANIMAVTNAQVGRLPDRLVNELLEQSLGFGRAIMEDLAAIVRSLSMRVFELNAVSAACRTQMEILRMAVTVGVVDNRSTISPLPTHAEIATLVGAQREAVTRECKRLEARGLVARKGRTLVVLDVDALVEEIERLGGDQPEA